MVILGLGSNVGARESMLDRAVGLLENLLGAMKISKRYETPALLLPGSPPEWNKPFLNMAVSGECALAPRDLLTELKKLEQQLGRQDRGRWAPREIDLDILAYDDVVLESVELTLPHPGLLTRYFALAPLAEVAPDWRWPKLGVHFGKMAGELRAELFP